MQAVSGHEGQRQQRVKATELLAASSGCPKVRHQHLGRTME